MIQSRIDAVAITVCMLAALMLADGTGGIDGTGCRQLAVESGLVLLFFHVTLVDAPPCPFALVSCPALPASHAMCS